MAQVITKHRSTYQIIKWAPHLCGRISCMASMSLSAWKLLPAFSVSLAANPATSASALGTATYFLQSKCSVEAE